MIRSFKKHMGAWGTVGPTVIWLGIFLFLPLVYVILITFLTKNAYGGVDFSFTLENYRNLFKSEYIKVFWDSIVLSLETTVICLLVGYPFAYILANAPRRWKNFLVLLLMLPFWTNSLIRTYGWNTLLRTEGIINHFLLGVGVIKSPLEMLYTDQAVLLGMERSDCMPTLQAAGLAAEETMLAATGGVNTHKGAIFSMGILACAAGACAARGDLSPEAVCAAAAVIAAPAAEDFARPVPPEQTTTGRILYRSRGITGIRGEAASGFASARQWALPVLEEFSGRSYPENDVHLHALLHLMANVCDTNILARGGPEGLDYLHASAKEVLALGGALTPAGKAREGTLDGEVTRRGLSPGGCADVLSVAILLHRLPALLPPGEEVNPHE